ncbi:class B sortase [Butyrivibrio sp. YAB3001]|uniref:class B sortase n=1 Tax=Butyrivibrio sp. YAB3001 TaxID=1520812 RepID=UPI0008F62B71|nr:class B sortase [Butyrivibrio sp. YAB3001]SFB72486.1 sortase, SrtB family [Butyrivibrio sp. YAB3001]
MDKNSFILKIKDFNSKHSKIVPYIVYFEVFIIFIISLISFLRKKIKYVIPALALVILLIFGIRFLIGHVHNEDKVSDIPQDTGNTIVETQLDESVVTGASEEKDVADAEDSEKQEEVAESEGTSNETASSAKESSGNTNTSNNSETVSEKNTKADQTVTDKTSTIASNNKSESTDSTKAASETEKNSSTTKTSSASTTVSNSSTSLKSSADAKEQLASVSAVYPEAIGWLWFEDELLSYPIMYSGDNTKYLAKDYTGANSVTGSIFLDYRSSLDFSDFNSIVYGHNMKDYSMFGAFKNYKNNAGYLANHKYFRIITNDGEYRYQIFAYMDISKSSEIYSVVGNKVEESKIRDLLNTVEYKTYIDTGIEPGITDKLVTLSTCTSSDQLNFVMFAVRLD